MVMQIRSSSVVTKDLPTFKELWGYTNPPAASASAEGNPVLPRWGLGLEHR